MIIKLYMKDENVVVYRDVRAVEVESAVGIFFHNRNPLRYNPEDISFFTIGDLDASPKSETPIERVV